MGASSNKYLSFYLADESYAIELSKVKEIIGMMKITKVPRMLHYFIGVINLRGKIIPVIDLRLKLELNPKEYDERTSIIVIEDNTNSANKTYAMVVDTVQEVLEIPHDSIEPPPSEAEISQQNILGIGKINESVIMLIDIDRIFNFTENEEEII